MPTHVTESTDASITAEFEFTTGTCTIDSTAAFTADVISETTANAGITIDGVRLRDNGVSVPAKAYIDNIVEYTSGAGVTVDGVWCRDGGVTATETSFFTGVSTTESSLLAGVAISDSFSLSGDQVDVSEGGTGVSSLTTNGMVYMGASTFAATSAGTSGQFLTANEAGTPTWEDKVEYIGVVCVAPATDLTQTSDVAQFHFPFKGYIQTAFAGVSTEPTGNGVSVDVWVRGATIFTTMLGIDRAETTSTDATEPVAIGTGTSHFVQWDLCRIHVHREGSTTAAKGLVVTLVCVRD